MPVDPEELVGARIERTMHCDACGYNLYMLPMAGRCPECGGRYNARGRRMQGIFLPYENQFPWSDIMATLLSGSLCAGLGLGFLVQRPLSLSLGLWTAIFAIATAVAAPIAWRDLCRYVRFRKIESEDDKMDV